LFVLAVIIIFEKNKKYIYIYIFFKSTSCIWYFSHGEEGQKHAPVSTSIYRAFRYHLGSLAFGSLLLAIV
jgi:hypothetical protein